MLLVRAGQYVDVGKEATAVAKTVNAITPSTILQTIYIYTLKCTPERSYPHKQPLKIVRLPYATQQQSLRRIGNTQCFIAWSRCT